MQWLDKIQSLTTDAIEWDKRSKNEKRNGRNDNSVLFEQIRDLEIKSANLMEITYFDTDKPRRILIMMLQGLIRLKIGLEKILEQLQYLVQW